MSERDARDPYLGLNNHIRQQARSQIPTYYTVGKVVSLRPLMVRAAGMNLDRDDLKIAQHLLAGWTEHLTNLEWPTKTKLPEKKFQIPFSGNFIRLRNNHLYVCSDYKIMRVKIKIFS